MRKQKKLGNLMAFLLLATVLSFVDGAQAAVLNVCPSGCTYSSIQAAIDDASDGDTVLVGDGNYYEMIDLGDKEIRVESVNGASVTIIDGSHCGSKCPGSVIKLRDTQSIQPQEIKGFTVTGGGVGIECDGHKAIITDCIISGNCDGIFSDNFAMIGSILESSLEINGCIIKNNTTLSNGYNGGILTYCFTEGPALNLVVNNCTISNNRYYRFYSDNDYYYGGGIVSFPKTKMKLNNCIISDNSAYIGGGIYLIGDQATVSSASITNCTISGNEVQYGAGIKSENFSLNIKNSIIWDNVRKGDNPPSTTRFESIDLQNYCFPKLPCLRPREFSVTYSDVQGGWLGIGNLNTDPTFVGNNNYHLKAGSPCIDAGTNVGAPLNDIDGEARLTGWRVDMGADEYPLPNIKILSDGSWKSFDALQPNWETINYDDYNWRHAYAPYYNPNPPLITGTKAAFIWDYPAYPPVIPNGKNGPDNAWFRKSFYLPWQPNQTTKAEAKIAVDDDYDFYVNGVQVFTNHDCTASTPPDIVDLKPYLVAGKNVLALKGNDCYGIYESVLFDASIEKNYSLVSGDGYYTTYYSGISYRTQVSVNIDPEFLSLGMLRYYDSKRKSTFTARSIESVDFSSADIAVITGTGELNLNSNHRFTARITDSSNYWEITIYGDNGVILESASANLNKGDLIVKSGL